MSIYKISHAGRWILVVLVTFSITSCGASTQSLSRPSTSANTGVTKLILNNIAQHVSAFSVPSKADDRLPEALAPDVEAYGPNIVSRHVTSLAGIDYFLTVSTNTMCVLFGTGKNPRNYNGASSCRPIADALKDGLAVYSTVLNKTAALVPDICILSVPLKQRLFSGSNLTVVSGSLNGTLSCAGALPKRLNLSPPG